MARATLAQDYVRSGLLDAAGADYLDLVLADRTNLAAYVGLAETYALRGAEVRALDLLQSVLEFALLQGDTDTLPVAADLLHRILPDEEELRSWLATWLEDMTHTLTMPTQQRALCDLYLAAGRVDDAHAVWERARHDPKRDRLFGLAYSRMLLASGKVAEATKNLRRVVEGDETDFRAKAALSVVTALQSNRPTAWLSLREDLKNTPPADEIRVAVVRDILDLPASRTESLLHYALGTIQSLREWYADAHREFAQALSLLEGRTAADRSELESIIHQAIAEVYLSQGKVDEADREMERCSATEATYEPSFDSLVLRAGLLLKQDNREQAVAEIDKARRLVKSSSQAKKLVELLLNVLHGDPQSLSPRVSLADLYDRWGYSAEAARQLESVADVQRLKGMGIEARATLLRLARIYSASSKHEQAVSAFRRYVELDSDNLGIRQQMFNLLLKNGQVQDAVLAGREMVEVCVKVGQIERAIQLLQHLVVLETDDQALYKELGRLLASSCRYGEAIEALKRASSYDPDDAEVAALLRQAEGQATPEKV